MKSIIAKISLINTLSTLALSQSALLAIVISSPVLAADTTGSAEAANETEMPAEQETPVEKEMTVDEAKRTEVQTGNNDGNTAEELTAAQQAENSEKAAAEKAKQADAKDPGVGRPFESENAATEQAKQAEYQAKDPKESGTVTAGEVEVRRLEKTKIYSCDVTFPVNSVKFDEDLVQQCFKGIDMKKVSYIHIVATATITGTTAHNFYLSTRRAGGLEAYLQNRYPDVQVHAFGGGENPKFGKSARIFIVESADEATKEPPVPQQLMTDQTPPPREPKVIVETKIEKEYVFQKKLGIEARIGGAMANYRPNPSSYQLLGIEAVKTIDLPWLHETGVGVTYSMLRSNQKLDIHSSNVLAEKFVRVWHFGKSFAGLDLGLQANAGITQIEKERQSNVGSVAMIRYKDKDLATSLNGGYSRHFRWLGVSMGMSL